jgi:hypothetical protein
MARRVRRGGRAPIQSDADVELRLVARLIAAWGVRRRTAIVRFTRRAGAAFGVADGLSLEHPFRSR